MQADEEALKLGLRAEESQQEELKDYKPTQPEKHGTAEQVIYSFGNRIAHMQSFSPWPLNKHQQELMCYSPLYNKRHSFFQHCWILKPDWSELVD